MTYGAQFLNNGSALILSSQSPGLAYVGQAAYIGSADAPGSPSTAKVLGRYRISSVNEPLVFVEMAPDLLFGVYSVTLVGAGIWDILLYCSSVAGGNSATPTARVATVHCFAPLASRVSGGYGFWLFDSDQKCTFDLGAKMIQPRDIAEFTAAAPPDGSFDLQSYTMPIMSKPALCGLADGNGTRGIATSPGAGTSTQLDFAGAWQLRAPRTLDRTQMCVDAQPVDIPAFPLRMRYRASTVLLIDIVDY